MGVIGDLRFDRRVPSGGAVDTESDLLYERAPGLRLRWGLAFVTDAR